MKSIAGIWILALALTVFSVSPVFAEEKKDSALDNFAKGVGNAVGKAGKGIKNASDNLPKVGKSISDLIDKATGKDKKKK